MKTIGYREWKPGTIFYVANLPGTDNPRSDWGYVTNSAQAIHLTPYWQRRFTADCRRCNSTAKFVTIFDPDRIPAGLTTAEAIKRARDNYNRTDPDRRIV